MRCSTASRYCDRSEPALKVQSWTDLSKGSRPFGDLGESEALNDPRIAIKDQKVARLFDLYISNIAPWYDLSDASKHFELVVPRMALDEPLLFCAIIALSAMRMSRISMRSLQKTAEFYHAHCVRLLIRLQNDDRLITNGVSMAATCLLRSYEILEGMFNPLTIRHVAITILT